MSSLLSYCSRKTYDAVVIGAGPNGLSAACVLAENGLAVLLVEANTDIGGGCRSAALTLPGFTHDQCSSIHPLAVGSPYFRKLPLHKYGLEWCYPQAPYGHPFDNGVAAIVENSVEATAGNLGVDENAYLKLLQNPRPNWDAICEALLRPIEFAFHPVNLAKFGLRALLPAEFFARSTFKGPLARGLFAGLAAHSSVPLNTQTSSAIAMVLGMAAHTVGWPTVRGGAQNLSNSLATHFKLLGGEIVTSCTISCLDELPVSRLILCDVTPQQLLRIASLRLPSNYRRSLANYKYGAAVYKMDWALDAPIPWQAAALRRVGTVHIGGTIEEIVQSEWSISKGEHPTKPYVLLAQTSLFDSSRAPAGKHTAWAYCHVPNSSAVDMSAAIENQIERFAPGFKKLILRKTVFNSKKMEEHNENYVGGDINGGALIPSQLFARPLLRFIPYATPVPGLYICSSSTPPGPGVHGMCGYYAAVAAIRGWR